MIVAGDSSVLSWSGVTESSCGVYNNTTGQALASNIAASGSVTVSPTATTMYNLVCDQSVRSATVYIAQSLATGAPAIGKIIELATATNVRSTPTISGTPLGSQPAGARALVIGDSSAQADGYTWWNVDFRNASLPPEDNWGLGSTPHLTGWSIGNYMKEVVKLISRSYDVVCVNKGVDPARYFAISDSTFYKCAYWRENSIVFSNGVTQGPNPWLYNQFPIWLKWADYSDPALKSVVWGDTVTETLRKWEDLSSAEKTTILQESGQTMANP